MKAVIADDEPLARALLRTLLEEISDVAIVAEANDGGQLIAKVRDHRPDIAFLDIDMAGSNGIYAAMELADDPVEIIFVTAHEEHAIDAFEVGAIDYLLKPVRRPRLARAIDRARARHLARSEPAPPAAVESPARESLDAFWVPVRHGTARVAIADIVRVEAAGDHVYFHTEDRAYLYRTTMSDLDKKLRGSGLLRVHRSAFIRPERVTRTSRRGKVLAVSFADGTEIAVGPNYREAVLEHISRTS